MLITIDSMIWIYSYDPLAPEKSNVTKWISNDAGALREYDKIILSTIIPIEILHTLRKSPHIDLDEASEVVKSLINIPKVKLVDFSNKLLESSIELLNIYSKNQIGGRDASILSTM